MSPRFLLRLLRLWHRQCRSRNLDQFRHPRTVFPTIFFDEQKRFRTRVRWGFFEWTGEGFALVGRLEKQSIIADECDDFFIAVDRIFPEHFSSTDGACTGDLSDEKGDCGLLSGHDWIVRSLNAERKIYCLHATSVQEMYRKVLQHL